MRNDKKMGIYFTMAKNLQKAIDEYARTGDMTRFKQRMAALRTNYGDSLGRLLL